MSPTASITGHVSCAWKRCCRVTRNAIIPSVSWRQSGRTTRGLWWIVGLPAAGRPAPRPSERHGSRCHRCGIECEAGDQQAFLQKAADGLDTARRASPAADPHVCVK